MEILSEELKEKIQNLINAKIQEELKKSVKHITKEVEEELKRLLKEEQGIFRSLKVWISNRVRREIKKQLSGEIPLLKNEIEEEARRKAFETIGVARKQAERHIIKATESKIKDLKEEKEEAEKAAISDQLTKIFNRSYFEAKLEEELSVAKWLKSNVSLLILDIDFFKELNDSCGHLIGDSILEEIASILRQNVRAKDTVARFGGEEFAIILPRTDTHQAYTLAERIRSLIERHPFYDGSESSRKITVSIGVATYPLDALGKKDLIEKADRALYKAKRVGRNIVVISR